MKKLNILMIMLITSFMFMACEKEKATTTNNKNKTETTKEGGEESDIQDYYEAKFRKEIVAEDESGENQLFLAVYSDDKELLDNYVNEHEFNLLINQDDLDTIIGSEQNPVELPVDSFDTETEPQIIVDKVYTNLSEGVDNYSLNVESESGKSSKFPAGYPVSYTTKGDFIGSVHYGWGYDYITQYYYKEKWYSWGYDLYSNNGANAWMISPGYPYNFSYFSYPGNYRLKMIIRPHIDQNQQNYRVVYDKDQLYGQNCSWGDYDGVNCFIGSAPEGTNAFIWGQEGNRYFYYTPVNGDQCPYPGSHFDGANCQVEEIPDGYVPFVWANNWYVRPEVINY